MGSPDARVRARSVRQDGGCLVWTGCRTTNGYGQISIMGKRYRPHRVTWEAANGPIPDGLELDHLCRNRLCVEPSHLEAVSHAENVLRAAASRTHCPQGHEFSEANLMWKTKRQGGAPHRVCRRCRNDDRSRRRAVLRSQRVLSHG